jgi:hypothetical protein
MTTIGDVGRLKLHDPLLRRLFIRKEVSVAKRAKTTARRGEKSIVPYGDEYHKVQAFYRFVE